jgi:hypothetical protein
VVASFRKWCPFSLPCLRNTWRAEKSYIPVLKLTTEKVENAIAKYRRGCPGAPPYSDIQGSNLRLFRSHEKRFEFKRVEYILRHTFKDAIDSKAAWEITEWREWMLTVFWVVCAATYVHRVQPGKKADDAIEAVIEAVKKAAENHDATVPWIRSLPLVSRDIDLEHLDEDGEEKKGG